jgi:hypothetical protein
VFILHNRFTHPCRYEVLESETHEDQNKDNSLYEESLEEITPTPLISDSEPKASLKDTVLNKALDLLNKAVQTIVKSGLRSEPDGTDSWMLQSNCVSITQCIPSSDMEEKVYALLSCNASRLLPFLASKSPWCGWDYCHSIFSRNSIGLPWQPEGFYQSLFGGPSVLHALCHYVKPLKDGCSGRNGFSLIPNSSLSDGSSSSTLLEEMKSDGIVNQSIPTPNNGYKESKATGNKVNIDLKRDFL